MGALREPKFVKIGGVNLVKNQFCRLKAQPAHYQEYAIIGSISLPEFGVYGTLMTRHCHP